MYKEIDIEQWERKDIYAAFSSFNNPCTAVTASVCCTGLKAIAKQRGESLFIYHLYCILKAQNDIDEFRIRIMPDGRIVLFDRIDASITVNSDGKGRLVSLNVPWIEPFPEFYDQVRSYIAQVTTLSSVFTSSWSNKGEESMGLVFVDALPKLAFTSIVAADGLNVLPYCPLINIGMVTNTNGIETMPVAITSHHGLVDGYHITRFYIRMEENMAELGRMLSNIQ